MDLAEYPAAKAASDAKVDVLRQAVAKSAEEEAGQRARAEVMDLEARWDELDIDSRRRVVQALVERIEVGPAVKGRNYYPPERVGVTHR